MTYLITQPTLQHDLPHNTTTINTIKVSLFHPLYLFYSNNYSKLTIMARKQKANT
jgi:hypothetical protein